MMDGIELLIYYAIWILSISSFWFIPRSKRRHAFFILMFAQFPAWILGLVVVEAGWIIYPEREFPKANSTCFSFEYFVLPILCIFYNLYYPTQKTLGKRLLYTASFMSVFAFIEYLAEKYTRILKYTGWNWYWTLISMTMVFYIVRVVYKWFYKLGNPFSL